MKFLLKAIREASNLFNNYCSDLFVTISVGAVSEGGSADDDDHCNNLIIITAGTVGGVVIVAVLIIVATLVACYCCRHVVLNFNNVVFYFSIVRVVYQYILR